MILFLLLPVLRVGEEACKRIAGAPHYLLTTFFECLVYIIENIFNIFQADGDAY